MSLTEYESSTSQFSLMTSFLRSGPGKGVGLGGSGEGGGEFLLVQARLHGVTRRICHFRQKQVYPEC